MRIASIRSFGFGVSIAPVLGVMLLSGCGDSSGPDSEPIFPAVSGSYDLSGTFDGLSAADANFVGTITVVQPSREVGVLSGGADLTVEIAGDVWHAVFAFSDASVTSSGTLSFVLRETGTTASWTYTGTATGGALSGRHTLSAPSGTFSGNFSAARTGAATANAAFSVAGSDHAPAPLERVAQQLNE